jgi:signal transduction histidine kinase
MSGASKRFVAIAAFTALLIVLVNLAWWFYYERTAGLLEDQLTRRLRALAITAASAIDPPLIDGLLLDDPLAYLSALRTLEAVKRADSLSEVFIITDNYHYLATTLLESDSTYFLAALNGIYIDSILFSEAQPLVTATYHTGGIFLKSAFAPMYDSEGVLSAVLGLEANVDYFDALGELRRNLYYSTGLSLTGSFLFGLLFLALQRRINSAERRLFLTQTESYLGRMVSVVSHELKNPLMIIRGSAERVKRKTDMEEAGYIIEEIDRLNQIVSGYLDFARSGGTMLAGETAETFDLVEMAQTLKSHLTRSFADQPITWQETTFPDSLQFTGYRRSLRQVLLNLLLNGVEACRAADKPARIGLDLRCLDNHVLITVVDHGPGLERKEIARITDPFYTTKQTGSGLGLYVSRKIIADMGGSLEILSTEGSGSRFVIKLPQAPTG